MSSAPPERPSAAAPIPSPARWAPLLVVLCLGQFLLILILLLTRATPAPAPGGTTSRLSVYSATNQAPYFAGQPGPWGELEYVRIDIEPTDELVAREEQSLRPTDWFFEGLTQEQVLALGEQLGLTAAQRELLRQQATWSIEPAGCLVRPPGELIMTLAPEVRARLYSRLARNQRNDLQVWPYVYRQGAFAEWFGHSGLSNSTIALVQQVIYQRGKSLCISDAPELCARITDAGERQRLIKTLARTSSLLMKVRVRPDSDVKALTAYWGRGWRAKDIEPLFVSLTKVPGGITLDVAHLLPVFARKRLNSYPPPPGPGQRAPDGYWTAWNFFREPPDDRYYYDTIWRRELQQDYARVTQPGFGDLVFLTRPDGIPIQSAVFIADDVVFTKNGTNIRQPWQLMKLEDLLARYPEDYPLQVAIFRPKTNTD